VHRVVRIGPVRQVAARGAASRRCSRQRVVVVDVALRAGRHLTRWRHLVRVRQRKAGGGVIKGRVGPVRRVVAA